MKIVFLDAATMGNTPLTEIEKLGELTTYDSSTAEEARSSMPPQSLSSFARPEPG